METNNDDKATGLGDSIERLFESTGIKKLVEKTTEVLGMEDCGCSKRKKKLNDMFPYQDNGENS